jgi:hypothetical protein
MFKSSHTDPGGATKLRSLTRPVTAMQNLKLPPLREVPLTLNEIDEIPHTASFVSMDARLASSGRGNWSSADGPGPASQTLTWARWRRRLFGARYSASSFEVKLSPLSRNTRGPSNKTWRSACLPAQWRLLRAQHSGSALFPRTASVARSSRSVNRDPSWIYAYRHVAYSRP